MTKDENNIELDLINDANKIISRHNECDKKAGNLFNIFEILNIQRKEVICHEAFIHDLINPQGSHGQGDKYLKLFLEKVLSWDLCSFGEENVKVYKEFPLPDNKRLDLRIESDKSLVIIEMKIDQEDSKGQLNAYFKELNNSNYDKANRKLYYLTLFGNKPVFYKHFKHEDCISFKNEIWEWIKSCIKESAMLPSIREVLQQYANIVRDLTNQTEGDLTMALKQLLLKEAYFSSSQKIFNLAQEIETKNLSFWNNIIGELKKQPNNVNKIFKDKSRALNVNDLKFEDLSFKNELQLYFKIKDSLYIVIFGGIGERICYGFSKTDDDLGRYVNSLGFSKIEDISEYDYDLENATICTKPITDTRLLIDIIYDDKAAAIIAKEIADDTFKVLVKLQET